ncbi:Hypothetical predicted protein [Paramuricea clavata]|uniref:Uncharacterized protein n=1 Tax=Paramuricea clavata TaxID=317549 RepID=A0A7D9J840_PARCT|nr:Hypothetical predicted protein [Paramuricea clavata]
MAGTNLIGIKEIFGNEALEQVKTCKFHYKQIVNRRVKLLDVESAEEFEKRTEDGYTAARKELNDFTETNLTEQECMMLLIYGHKGQYLIEAQLKECKEGRAACGRGPSFRDRNFRK